MLAAAGLETDLSWVDFQAEVDIRCEGFDYKAYICDNAATWLIDTVGCTIDPRSWLCDDCFALMQELWDDYTVECEHGREVLVVRIERIKK